MSNKGLTEKTENTLIIMLGVLLGLGLIGVFTLAGIYDGRWLDVVFDWILPILGSGLTGGILYVLGLKQKERLLNGV